MRSRHSPTALKRACCRAEKRPHDAETDGALSALLERSSNGILLISSLVWPSVAWLNGMSNVLNVGLVALDTVALKYCDGKLYHPPPSRRVPHTRCNTKTKESRPPPSAPIPMQALLQLPTTARGEAVVSRPALRKYSSASCPRTRRRITVRSHTRSPGEQPVEVVRYDVW